MKIYRLLIITVVVFLFFNPVYADTKGDNVIVHFSKLLSLQELNDVMINHGIEPTELYFHDGDISGGYRLKVDESIPEALLKLSEKHEEALSSIFNAVGLGFWPGCIL